MEDRQELRLAIIGTGYWGPHYARIASEMPETELAWCCDADPVALDLPRRRYPGTRCTTDLDEVLSDDAVDAVVIATPSGTHRKIAIACLQAGKDVLVEKPLATSREGCLEIGEAVDDQILMVGHTFVFNPAIVQLRELVMGGDLGEIIYINSVRKGLGPIRQDVNVLWDLGPHDVAIILDLLRSDPVEVSAVGQSYLRGGVEDVVYIHIRFANGVLGNCHLSWLDPYKVRETTVVGSERMAVFDDVALDERLKVLDRGASYSAPSEDSRGVDYGDYRAVLRDGAIVIPKVSLGEPLREQMNEFLSCVRTRRNPYSGLEEGLRAVTLLEAAGESLRSGGAPVALSELTDAKLPAL